MGLAALRIPTLPSAMPATKGALVGAAGRAVYMAALRRPAEAQAAFDQLVKEHPNAPEVHELYGVFLAVSDPDGAVREWKKEIEISPQHVPARLQLAFEYLKRGDAAAGLPYAQEAVKLDAQSFATHNALGRLLVETDNVEVGFVALEKARDLAPGRPESPHA